MAFRYRAPLYREESEITEIALGTDVATQRAQQILAKAQELAAADGETEFADSLTIEEGERPKGRAYLRITADTANGEAVEFGDDGPDTNQARRRILGRAGGVVIFDDSEGD